MPQTECPAQEEAWRSTTERTPGAFRRLMSQCGSGVENCLLPDSVAGFVEGEHCSVLLKALGDGHLRPIGSMVDASVRDRNKPGACYVYFRVMKRGETPIRMAFGSVGSSRMEYKARMLFRPRIWTASRGGYVSDRDGMGTSTGPPSPRQSSGRRWRPFWPWTGQGGAMRRLASMARSPWRTLTAPGVCFPFPWTESSGRSKRGRGPVVPSRFWCARGGALPTWDGLGRRRIWPAQSPGWRACLPRQSWRRRSGGTRVCRPTSPMCRTGAWSQGAGRHTGFNFPDRRQNHGTMGSNDGRQDVYHRPG